MAHSSCSSMLWRNSLFTQVITIRCVSLGYSWLANHVISFQAERLDLQPATDTEHIYHQPKKKRMKDWEKGTIGIDFVHEALAAMLEQGIETETLLLQAGISPTLLSAPQARVAAANYGQLWYLIAQKLDDEFFGM